MISNSIRVSLGTVSLGLHHILSSFALLEDEDVPGQTITDENCSTSSGWTDGAVSIHKHVNIYIAPARCQIDYLHHGGTYMPLYARLGSKAVQRGLSVGRLDAPFPAMFESSVF